MSNSSSGDRLDQALAGISCIGCGLFVLFWIALAVRLVTRAVS